MVEDASFGTVSAIVPVYNGSATLRQCLESLASQGPSLKEIIVVDDGSSDNSWSIVEAFARREPRFVVQRHQNNAGIARTLNEAIARATGGAVLIIHQDCALDGRDWLQRGLAILRRRPRTCLSGRPVFPFAEFSPVEAAFGMLRDTFFTPEEDEEPLGFSEFKCDLLPRDAFRLEGFDERFRASGEDQVFSSALRAHGYSLVRVRSLQYYQRFGNAGSVRSQLRKEFAYGRTEGGILVQTSMRIAAASHRSVASSRRLANRVAALLVPLSLLSAVTMLVLTRSPWLGALPLVLLLPRLGLVVARWRSLPQEVRARDRAGVLALALVPLNDALYGVAVVSGVVAFATVHRV